MIHHLAPWVPPFIQSLKNHTSGPFLPFQISTLHEIPEESDSSDDEQSDMDTDYESGTNNNNDNNTNTTATTTENMQDSDDKVKKSRERNKKSLVRPSCRTVVFRDFLFNDKKTNVLTYVTDLRSNKIKDIKNNGGVFEACIYFPDSYEQYRFSGETQIVISLDTIESLALDPLVAKNLIVSPEVCGGHPNIVLKETEQLIKLKKSDEDEGEYGEEVNEEEKEGAVGVESTGSGDNESEKSEDTNIYSTSLTDNLNDHELSLDEQIRDGDNPEAATTEENKDIDFDTYAPPTAREWELELQRHWINLSKTSKSQYRKPEPGLKITDELEKKLDKITRGVDGQTEDAGLQNFGIVCMIIDKVDYLNLKNNGNRGERWLYKKQIYQDENGEYIEEMWEEEEVCP